MTSTGWEDDPYWDPEAVVFRRQYPRDKLRRGQMVHCRLVEVVAKLSELGAPLFRQLQPGKFECDVSRGCQCPQHVGWFARRDRPARPKRRLRSDEEVIDELARQLFAFGGEGRDREWETIVADRMRSTHGFPAFDRSRAPTDYVSLDLDVPCRRCERCLKWRRRHWERRAMIEMSRRGVLAEGGNRAWMITLSLHPDAHYRALCQCIMYAQSRQLNWNELKPGTRMRMLMNVKRSLFGRRVSAWIKALRDGERVPPMTAVDRKARDGSRKEAARRGEKLPRLLRGHRYRPATFVYWYTVEVHSNVNEDGTVGSNFGNPHVHMLLTETTQDGAVRYDRMQALWHNLDRGPGEWMRGIPAPFFEAELVKAVDGKSMLGAVRYCSKYISKDPNCIVRCSCFYGRDRPLKLAA